MGDTELTLSPLSHSYQCPFRGRNFQPHFMDENTRTLRFGEIRYLLREQLVKRWGWDSNLSHSESSAWPPFNCSHLKNVYVGFLENTNLYLPRNFSLTKLTVFTKRYLFKRKVCMTAINESSDIGEKSNTDNVKSPRNPIVKFTEF